MRRSRLILALAGGLAVLLALSLASWAGNFGPRRERVRSPSGLVVAGSIKGLYPGARKRLRLKIRNRLGVRMKLTSLTVLVRDGRWNCRGANVRVGRFRGRLLLPPRRRRAVTLVVSMPKTAPDPCQGAVFRLVFRAKAVRA
ncbi:MAG: hypothetical protein QOD43_698 [Gaiellaceae bacterium]|nr:hypothetical protein [Gaiellaceae bacterium]